MNFVAVSSNCAMQTGRVLDVLEAINLWQGSQQQTCFLSSDDQITSFANGFSTCFAEPFNWW